MLLSTLIDGFLLDCRARRLRRGTVERAYAPVLRELCGWLNNPQVTDITTEDLRRYVAYLSESNRFGRVRHPSIAEQDRPLAAWTVYRHVRTIKRLFNWAQGEGILSDNPATGLRYPKVPKTRVEIFSPDEIESLLKEARAVSYRNYAVVFLLLDSGIRRGELCALALDDVNVITGVVVIRYGKGDKARSVRVGNACRKVLWQYAAEFREPAHTGVDAFFVNRWGGPMTGSGLAQMLARLGRKTGLHVHSHKFRHTWATLFATRTPNALLLADALGHTTLEMARHYVHLAGTMSTDVDMSPMDWLLSSKA